MVLWFHTEKENLPQCRAIPTVAFGNASAVVLLVPWLAALVLSLLWLYGATLLNLVREWTISPDSSYGLILAIVALWIVWRRRVAVVALATSSRRADPLGLALLASGLLFYLAGQLAADLFVTRISLVVVAAGAIAFCAGRATLRVLAAPVTFLAIAMPLPTIVVNTITLPLQLVASRVAELSLMLLAVPVFREGNLLTLPSSTLEVAEACSGLRSLVSLAAIAVMLAWMVKRGIARRAFLVASTVPIAVVMNGFRIAATGMAIEQWGPALGKGAWHEFTGWVTFVASLAALFALRRVVNGTGPHEQTTDAPREGFAAA
jgi:exosortase